MRQLLFIPGLMIALLTTGCSTPVVNQTRLMRVDSIAVIVPSNPAEYDVRTIRDRLALSVGLGPGAEVLTQAFSSDESIGTTGDDALQNADLRIGDHVRERFLTGLSEGGFTPETFEYARPITGNPRMRYRLLGTDADAVLHMTFGRVGYFERAIAAVEDRYEYLPSFAADIILVDPQDGFNIYAQNYLCGVGEDIAVGPMQRVIPESRFIFRTGAEDVQDPTGIVARNIDLATEGIRICADAITTHFLTQILTAKES